MIQSFRHRGLKRFYERDDQGQIDSRIAPRVRQILTALDVMSSLDDVRIPTWRLHPLTGDRQGQWSLTVRANWRITFRFEDGDVLDVDLVDYH